MASETKCGKVWFRFVSKKKDGEIVKLRIQDLSPNRFEDFLKFNTTYFIKDEAIHKAAGIANNTEAIEEYKTLCGSLYEDQRPQIAICCRDDDSEDFDKILAISTVQLVSSNDIPLEDVIRKMGLDFKTKEVKTFIHIIMVLRSIFPKSVKEKYSSFYRGKGIIVHPDYRGLGIASKMIEQRRLLLQEYNVPMTCAWMTSIGSQKPAEKDGWETIAEVTLEELAQLTGVFFEKNVRTFKMMKAT